MLLEYILHCSCYTCLKHVNWDSFILVKVQVVFWIFIYYYYFFNEINICIILFYYQWDGFKIIICWLGRTVYQFSVMSSYTKNNKVLLHVVWSPCVTNTLLWEDNYVTQELIEMISDLPLVYYLKISSCTEQYLKLLRPIFLESSEWRKLLQLCILVSVL